MDQISRDQNTDNSAVAQTTLWFGRNTGIGQDQNTAISTSAQTTLWVGRNRYTPCAIQLKLDANLHKWPDKAGLTKTSPDLQKNPDQPMISCDLTIQTELCFNVYNSDRDFALTFIIKFTTKVTWPLLPAVVQASWLTFFIVTLRQQIILLQRKIYCWAKKHRWVASPTLRFLAQQVGGRTPQTGSPCDLRDRQGHLSKGIMEWEKDPPNRGSIHPLCPQVTPTRSNWLKKDKMLSARVTKYDVHLRRQAFAPCHITLQWWCGSEQMLLLGVLVEWAW